MKLYAMTPGPCLSSALNSEQPLSPQGREQAAKAAMAMGRMLLKFDYLLTGPASAALETASIVRGALGYPEEALVCVDVLRSGVPPEELVEAMQGLPREASVFMVGPRSRLEYFLDTIMGWGAKGSLFMEPGGLTCVEIMSFSPVRGRLLWHLTAGQLRLVAGSGR